MLLTKSSQAIDGAAVRPIFRYYGYRHRRRTAGDAEQLNAPLSAADASRVVMIKVAFRRRHAHGRAQPDERDATTLRDDVYVRLADPTQPTEGPRCL